MKRLSVTTQGIKGGQSKTSTQGYAMFCTNGDKLLSIDNFHGSGMDYKQREEPVICIFNDQNCIFEGTHKQLIEKLTK